MAKTKQPQPKSFEEAIGELERILAEMERGEVPLEESLTRYERGTFLLQFCRQVLGKAEQQIESMSASAGVPAESESSDTETDDGTDEDTGA